MNLKNYLLKTHGLYPAMMNFFLNGLISWSILRNSKSISIWGEGSVGLDLLITAFLIPFITCIINSVTIAKKIKRKELFFSEVNMLPASKFANLPVVTKSLLLGFTALVFAGIPTVLLLQNMVSGPLNLNFYIIFKACWAGIIAGVTSPIIALWAIQIQKSRRIL